MGNFLETIYDVLFKPRYAMKYIAAQKLTGQALAMFVISMLVPVWAIFSGVKGTDSPALGLLFLAHLIGSIIIWVLSASVLSFIAELIGGRGSAVGLFAALGFTHIPRIAVTPLWVLAALLPDALKGIAFGVIGLIAVTWTLVLDAMAISGSHELSVSKAVLVLLSPVLVILALITLVVIFAGSSIMHWFVNS